MTEKNNSSSIEEKYQEITANLRKTKRISPFWLLPFIALCIGAILFFQIVKERGTSITITFTNGSGIVADKTQIRYQGLQIGIVKEVHFTDNLQKWKLLPISILKHQVFCVKIQNFGLCNQMFLLLAFQD